MRSAEKRERVEATLGVEKAYKKLAKAVSGAMVGYAAEFAHVFLTEAEGSKFALSNDEKVESYACPTRDATSSRRCGQCIRPTC